MYLFLHRIIILLYWLYHYTLCRAFQTKLCQKKKDKAFSFTWSHNLLLRLPSSSFHRFFFLLPFLFPGKFPNPFPEKTRFRLSSPPDTHLSRNRRLKISISIGRERHVSCSTLRAFFVIYIHGNIVPYLPSFPCALFR